MLDYRQKISLSRILVVKQDKKFKIRKQFKRHHARKYELMNTLSIEWGRMRVSIYATVIWISLRLNEYFLKKVI